MPISALNLQRLPMPLVAMASLLAWPASGADIAASIPNLTGKWGRPILNFEQPSSGTGPIVNTIRKADGTIDDNAARVGDYTSPLLKPEAAEVLRKRGEFSLGGNAIPDPHNQCWPEPPPFTLSIQFGIQLLQQRDKVTLIYVADQKVRHVRLNVPHSEPVTPTWQGDSVGHYEGDTLVIDTIGIKTGPLAVIDRYGTPFSAALHVVERYRLIDGEFASETQRKHSLIYGFPYTPNRFIAYGLQLDPDSTKKGLQVEVTVDDPGVFSMPWTGLVTYRPITLDWPEAVCAENPHSWGGDIRIPTADKPDF